MITLYKALGGPGDSEAHSSVPGLVLVAVLLYWPYRGSRVAKWVAIVFGLAAGLHSLLGSGQDAWIVIPPDRPAPLDALYGVVLLGYALTLLFSRSVNAYLAQNRSGARNAEPPKVAPPAG